MYESERCSSMNLFDKILIANRGEIAVRIIRSCKELGIQTVAIYSNADRYSLHVLLADEAYSLGSPIPNESYLNIEKIIDIAKRAHVDAIHPGYGFLSQNPEFAKRCEEEDITFIGPPAKVHEFSGDKFNAKRFLKERGIPVIPGSSCVIDNISQALDEADKIGYPIMVKPQFGGGGIGMKVCYSPEDLQSFIEISLKLAFAAFGSTSLYLERYFPNARHIEVQILADKYGNIIHLYERECSIQRRFQKIVEEAPSPALNRELREYVTNLALKIAKAIGYENAGTIEFLYIPDDDKFFFMELNSRIQVEHPVTEMITGVDIVKEQIKIAAGEPLDITQDAITIKGHAIEARIYAEDPLNDFLPSLGTITNYIPPRGIGIRIDDWVYPGIQISEYYDPLIAKLIVWGRDRIEAIARMKRALEEFIIEGVKTNIPLHLSIMKDNTFLKGTYNTRYLDNFPFHELPNIVHKIPHIPSKTLLRETPIPSLPHNLAWKLSGRILRLHERDLF